MAVISLPNFAKGEISPTLYARVDTAMYKSALRTARNAIIHPYGGVSNRPGTVCIGPVKDHANSPRLFRFHLGTTDQYVLEFGNLYMRVIRNDAYVLNTATTITAATATDPVQITAAAHGFSTGEDVVIASAGGMVEINAGMFTVANALTNTVELTSQVTGNSIDGTTFTAYTSGGTIADVFELTTSYVQADLATLKMVQTGNVLTITHPNYAPADLTRSDHNAWTLADLTYAPTLAAPATVSISSSTNTNFTVFETRNQTVNYQVTSIEDTDNYFEESLATTGTTTDSSDPPLNTITWDTVTNADRYAIYRQDNGIYGLVGETEGTATLSFEDDNLAADLTVSPPRSRAPFTSNAPATSGYYQQRQVYGGSDNNPDTLYFSQTGLRLNMSVSNPLQADDAITSSLSSQDVQQVRHFVPLDDLLVFTNAAEWRVNSGGDSAFSADTIKYTPQTTWGSSHQVPIIIGRTVIFVEDGGANVRALGFSLSDDGYNSPPLTLLADHLLAEKSANEYTITDWAHQQFPEPRIYMVRSDGKMLTLTFNQEQEVIAWTVWDTDGEYESVTSLRRSLSQVEDGLYFVIKRIINGETQRTIERMHTRKYIDVQDTFFLDLGAELNSPVAITNISSTGVVTSAGHGFSEGDEVEVSEIEWKKTVDSLGNETNPAEFNGGRYKLANVTSGAYEFLKRTWAAGDQWNIGEEGAPETSFTLAEVSGDPRAVEFNTTGLKMFQLDTGSSTIYEYDLGSAFDLGTAVYNSVNYDFSAITSTGRGMAFSDDGTTVLLSGENTDGNATIYQITLSGAFDMSTASDSGNSTTISTQVDDIFDIETGKSGTRLYVCSRQGNTSDIIFQYTMTTAYDASTITYNNRLRDVSDIVEHIRSVFVRRVASTATTVGIQVFVTDNRDDGPLVHEYNMITPFEIDTMHFVQTLTLNGVNCISGVFFQQDDDAGAFDMAGVTYNNVSIAGQTVNVAGLTWKSDGKRFYQSTGGLDNSIYQYDVSTAWDLSTAGYNGVNINISGDGISFPTGLQFKSDGLKFFVSEGVLSGAQVESYTLTSAWDLSTASADGVLFDPTTQITGVCRGVAVRPDGLRFWLVHQDTSGSDDAVYEYAMSAAWDLSTASYNSVKFVVQTEADSPLDMAFNNDGSKMFIADGIATATVFQYTLSTPYDVSTAVVASGSADLDTLTGNSTAPEGLFFHPSGTKMFITSGGLDDNIYEFNVSGAALDDRKMYINQGCTVPSIWQFSLGANRTDEEGWTTSETYFRGGEVREVTNIISGLAGLHCLNNTEVCLMADGVLEANQTVTNNTVTIADGKKVARAAIGLCYTADIETLDIELGSSPGTVQGKDKKITEVMTRFYKSAMPLVGPTSNDLVQMKGREDDEYGEPQALVTGDRVTNIPASWNSNGRVFYRMKDPFPLTILGIFPDITIEEDSD